MIRKLYTILLRKILLYVKNVNDSFYVRVLLHFLLRELPRLLDLDFFVLGEILENYF